MSFPVIAADAVGWISRDEMVEVDRVMIDDLGISLLQMMENAGRNLARVAIELFDPGTVWSQRGRAATGAAGSSPPGICATPASTCA